MASVCVRERDGERERARARERECERENWCVLVCVCVHWSEKLKQQAILGVDTAPKSIRAWSLSLPLFLTQIQSSATSRRALKANATGFTSIARGGGHPCLCCEPFVWCVSSHTCMCLSHTCICLHTYLHICIQVSVCIHTCKRSHVYTYM